MSKKNRTTERLTMAEKEGQGQKWYKQKIDSLYRGRTEIREFVPGDRMFNGQGRNSRALNMKVNYDLFNNILNPEELKHVCRPFGGDKIDKKMQTSGVVKMTNKDIVSNKIKAILGMEMKRPLDFTVYAVNSEATTRKEELYFEKIKEFVINSIMEPIQKRAEQEIYSQENGPEALTPEKKQELDAQVQERLKTLTPDQVKEYMEEQHQDPAEIQAVHLLRYLQYRTDAKRKFNEGCKHAALVAHEAYWVGEHRGHPDFRVVDDMRRVTYDKSPGVTFFEDGEYFCYEYLWTPSQVISFFGDDLSNNEIDKIYTDLQDSHYGDNYHFDFSNVDDFRGSDHLIPVFHATWKSLKELCILSYYDEETDEILKKIVSEDYKLNPEIGDIIINKEWITEAYEGYLINGSIYKKMGPIPGQHTDINDLHNCKLSYYGAVYDATNSNPTSIMDRGKPWLYFNNTVNYRIEQLMANDKGKKAALNYKSIPMEDSLDMDDFLYYSENSPYMFLDPSEEGSGYNDVNMSVKVVDLSLMSDIGRYMEISTTIKEACGEAMGVSRQMEAQIAPSETATGARQAIIQNNYILEPFFNLHNHIKRNVLDALIKCGKIVYRNKKNEVLTYVLDDMSVKMFELDVDMLNASTLGLFVTDGTKGQDIKDTITQLAHAALQNQQIKLSDVLTIMKEDSIEAAESKLKKSEKEAIEIQQAQQREALESQERMQKAEAEREDKKHQNEIEKIRVKEEERRETVIVQSALTGASFNPDQDADNDGINDFVEIAKHGLNAEIQRRKQDLAEKVAVSKDRNDKEKLNLTKEKLDLEKQKLRNKNT